MTKKVLKSFQSLVKAPISRIGDGVHGEGGQGPRLEPLLVLHLDQLVPVHCTVLKQVKVKMKVEASESKSVT